MDLALELNWNTRVRIISNRSSFHLLQQMIVCESSGTSAENLLIATPFLFYFLGVVDESEKYPWLSQQKSAGKALSFATAPHVVDPIHQILGIPRRIICHPNIGHHCRAVETCCIRYPRIVAVDSLHSLPVCAQAQRLWVYHDLSCHVNLFG